VAGASTENGWTGGAGAATGPGAALPVVEAAAPPLTPSAHPHAAGQWSAQRGGVPAGRHRVRRRAGRRDGRGSGQRGADSQARGRSRRPDTAARLWHGRAAVPRGHGRRSTRASRRPSLDSTPLSAPASATDPRSITNAWPAICGVVPGVHRNKKICPDCQHRGGHLPCVPTPVLLLSACPTRRSWPPSCRRLGSRRRPGAPSA
jgi:hypothetical protein